MASTSAKANGVKTILNGMPMTRIASPQAAANRQVVRRLRVCSSKKLIRSTGPGMKDWRKEDRNGEKSKAMTGFPSVHKLRVVACSSALLLGAGESPISLSDEDQVRTAL